jgi:hypothetical protein
MAEKRLFIYCSPKEFAKRQRRLGAPANVECLETLWVTEILPRLTKATYIVHLASTCRFFRDLYARQPSRFWHEQCIRYNWDRLVFSSNINYKNIFISATFRRCIDCHEKVTPAAKTDEITWMAYVHNGCRNPNDVISASKAAKEFHIPATLVKTLPDVRNGVNSRYFVADVQVAAYAHCGSKEKWEAKHTQLLKRHESLEKKKETAREAEIKELIDPIVAKLGKEFETDGWHTSEVSYYISTGKTKYSREAKYRQLERLFWKEIKRRLENVVAKHMKTHWVHVNGHDISTWFRVNPEKMAIFKQHGIPV